MTSAKFHALFGGPPREPEAPLTQREMDLAASIQAVTEEIMLRIGRHVHAQTGMKNLVPGRRRGAQLRRQRPDPPRGAVRRALDSAGGGRRGRRARRRAVRLAPTARQPARRRAGATRQQGSLLGPRLLRRRDRSGYLDGAGAVVRRVYRRRARCATRSPTCSREEKVVGWFQGRMEFGPRALGCAQHPGRCPRPRRMQSVMNLKIKFRECFRPFAPAVLREHCAEYFDAANADSPYMLLVAPVRGTAARDRCRADERQAVRTRQAQGTRARRSRPSRTSTTRRACRPSTPERRAAFRDVAPARSTRRPAARC